MDSIIRYLSQFYYSRSQGIQEGTTLLIDTYKRIVEREELQTWRFHQGKKRANDFQPMYCAFATTPYSHNDWFILRLVKAKSKDGNPQVSIGFCLDYGVQEDRYSDYQPITERRKEIRQKLEELKIKDPHLLDNGIPFPISYYQPHAYKGFEWEFEMPNSHQELADIFIATVLQWEKVFNLL